MTYLYLTIVLIHGLIHVLGFLKAFGLSELKELTLPISKPFGIVWLLATALFLIYALLLFAGATQAWIIGILSVIVSQVIIISFWKDAKFGTIPNAIVLGVCLVSHSSLLV